jgi:hypothetical protein
MANQTDDRAHNRPSHEASVKGGQHSHQGSHENKVNQQEQSNEGKQGDDRSHNQPSHDAQTKGGQHSHSGSQKNS